MALGATISNIAVTGLWTAAATGVAVMVAAVQEHKSMFAPINAISHILFGDAAIGVKRPIPKFLFSGLVLNLFAMFGWAALAELGYQFLHITRGQVLATILVSVVVTVVAYVTDFILVPKRFTPGFERIISQRALVAVYGVLAAAFVLSGLMRG